MTWELSVARRLTNLITDTVVVIIRKVNFVSLLFISLYTHSQTLTDTHRHTFAHMRACVSYAEHNYMRFLFLPLLSDSLIWHWTRMKSGSKTPELWLCPFPIMLSVIDLLGISFARVGMNCPQSKFNILCIYSQRWSFYLKTNTK